MGDEQLEPTTAGPDHGDKAWSGHDEHLDQVGRRASRAGLGSWWTQFRNPRTGRGEGPLGLRVNLRSGKRFRSVNLNSGEEAAVLLHFPFESWIVLRGYDAILDPGSRRIIAAITVRGTSLSKIPSVMVGPPEEPLGSGLADLRTAFNLPASAPGPSRLAITNPGNELSVELSSRAADEVEALRGSSNRFGHALIIYGVDTSDHDQARDLLEDLAAAVFIELDRSYGLAGTLQPAIADDLTEQEYDPESISSDPPHLPSVRYGRDAASLYLYARTVPSALPLLQYLGFYQVIEYHMAAFARSMIIRRVTAVLNDPQFDSSDDLAVDRLIDVVLPGGRSRISERDQVLATVEACLDNTFLNDFLQTRPAAAKALRNTNNISGVRLIVTGDAQPPLARQVAERIYGLRCRIVHSKESRTDSEPLHPFGPEARRMQHDLHLIRLVALHVLAATSKPAPWC